MVDALSRLEVDAVSTTAPLDFEAMTRAQETDADIASILVLQQHTVWNTKAQKITPHNKAPVGAFDNPDARFDHVHIDLVAPVPTCQGHTHVLLMVNRFSRWPKAVLIADIFAEIVAKYFASR